MYEIFNSRVDTTLSCCKTSESAHTPMVASIKAEMHPPCAATGVAKCFSVIFIEYTISPGFRMVNSMPKSTPKLLALMYPLTMGCCMKSFIVLDFLRVHPFAGKECSNRPGQILRIPARSWHNTLASNLLYLPTRARQ